MPWKRTKKRDRTAAEVFRRVELYSMVIILCSVVIVTLFAWAFHELEGSDFPICDECFLEDAIRKGCGHE